MSEQDPNFFTDLEKVFSSQISRLESELKPHGSHSSGPRKPTLEEQEEALLTPIVEDDERDE